jgi:hypothetical protein
LSRSLQGIWKSRVEERGTPNTVAGEKERVGKREGGREGNKIWNSRYRVWDRDNTGAGEMDIE